MRSLKFRAWIKKRKGYRELDQFGFDNQGIEEVWVFPKDGEIQQVYNPLDVVVEQYTGLTDKNGKEIYEGDILRTTDRVTVKDLIFPIGVVEFKQQAFWICNVPSERPDFTHNETLLQYWETDLEVIGNVHENQELLGDEE